VTDETDSGAAPGGSIPAGQIPAGWNTDPTGRFQLRYWDGTAWTDHVSTNGVQQTDPVAGGAPAVPVAAGASPAAVPVAAAPRARVVWPTRTRVLVLAGAALLALGSVLPWAKLEVSSGAFSVSDTKNGLDGDGVLTLVLAVVAFLIFLLVKHRKVTGWSVTVAGFLAGAIAIYDIVDVKRAFDDLNIPSGINADATVGVGLWIAAIAAVALFAGGVLCLMQRDDATPAAPPA
jgi:hypothetical protein